MMKILGIDPSVNGSGFTQFEIDDEYNILSSLQLGFTKKKKEEFHGDNLHVILLDKNYGDYEYHHRGGIILRSISKYIDIREIDYMAIEDYSFGSVGNTFDIAEFVGSLKQVFYTNGIPFKKYAPSSIKQFATNKGVGDKVPMGMAYNSLVRQMDGYVDLVSELPDFVSPKSDIIDSFFIAMLLLYELEYYNTSSLKNKFGRNLDAIFGGKVKKKTLPTISHPIIKPVEPIIPLRSVD